MAFKPRQWGARHVAVEDLGSRAPSPLIQRESLAAALPPPLGLLSHARSCRNNRGDRSPFLPFLLHALLVPATRLLLLKAVLRFLESDAGSEAPNQTREALRRMTVLLSSLSALVQHLRKSSLDGSRGLRQTSFNKQQASMYVKVLCFSS